MGVSPLPEIRRPRFNHPENFSTGFGEREGETSKQCWVGRGRRPILWVQGEGRGAAQKHCLMGPWHGWAFEAKGYGCMHILGPIHPPKYIYPYLCQKYCGHVFLFYASTAQYPKPQPCMHICKKRLSGKSEYPSQSPLSISTQVSPSSSSSFRG